MLGVGLGLSLESCVGLEFKVTADLNLGWCVGYACVRGYVCGYECVGGCVFVFEFGV